MNQLQGSRAPRERGVTSAERFGGDAVIVCDNLVKIFQVADLEVVALQGLDLVVEHGELMAIVGASGSGKSTLLGVLGGLLAPSAGHVRVDGHDLLTMGPKERTRFRRRSVGFVWQQTMRNLLSYLTAAENVELPMRLDGRGARSRRAAAAGLLEEVGLGHRMHHRPRELSGGEQQRVAIAIALANSPAVLFADEPTGELDSQTAAEVVDVLRRVNAERGVTVVVVTHDRALAGSTDRTVAIRDGRTSSEILRRSEGSGEGSGVVVAEEFAVLDRVGRLQLPDDYVAALGLEHRVRLTLEPDRIEVWPDADTERSPDDAMRPSDGDTGGDTDDDTDDDTSGWAR